MSAAVARKVVARGAKSLDKRMPGWHRKVAITSLNMGSSCSCVLGQLAGRYVNLDAIGWEDDVRPSYSDMVDALKLDEFKFGFDTWGREVTYDELRDAWIAAIRERRAA